ncbi:MAG: PQQ-dependent sugar dehydrogenase [Ilumatobacteraceae bacterium]
MLTSRTLAFTAAAALALVGTACSSDGSSATADPTASSVPSTDADASTEPDIAADPTSPQVSDDTLDDGTQPVESPTTPAPDAPLVEPSVELFGIGAFDQPVDVTARLGHPQVFVVEQPGRVVAVTDLSMDVALDITDLTTASGEQGLLGLAFHPTEDLAYVDYIDQDGNTVVAEFSIDPTTSVFDRDSIRTVLTVGQPYSNHNGGELAFGPDGLLFIGLGDGGSGGDPDRNGLDLGTRLGKILRIDPQAAGDEPFTVPPDNPYVGVDGVDPTIWSSGLRNPWRFSFDRVTGDLWIADVGQGDIEEINRAAATGRVDAGKGLNFGWSAFEGNEAFNEDQSPDGAVGPVYTYDHGDGRCSVSGGVVARDSGVSTLDGWYVFGDYCTGQIWALDPADPTRVVEIAQLTGLAAIAEGPDYELYAISNAGTVSRFIAA